MEFAEVLSQVIELLQRQGRVSYGALKRQLHLDEEYLQDLKDELIDAQRVAVDEAGKVLVWVGKGSLESSVQIPESKTANLSDARPQPLAPNTQPPISYTPPHLAERIRAEQVALQARSGTDGERKTITALFADLKGSTALIEGLDPEEARAIIDPALQLMMEAVHRYEGYVAQALGDGIFALFGAPIAHEDHPQRALYAALRMQDEMRRYSDRVRLRQSVPLAMRVGVNTGEVVVRSIRKDDLHADYVPVGHSTNLAARMEQMATPGSILITEHTRRLVEGYFELKALGAATIKGVEAPLHVYEVIGAGPLRTRLQVSARRGLTRFVGRHSELDQLRRALEQAKAGHGQIVGVMGEPGLGKSRLFYEFKLLSRGGCLVLEAYSVSHGKASPYLPVIELLKNYFQIQPQDDERQRKEKIAGKALMLDRSLEDTLPYLFFLLGIEDSTSSLQQMDAQIRRKRTFEALKKLFLRESLNQPLILIFEDLHWIDSETQGFLDTLSDGLASARILLLVNYRPEYRHEWGQKTYYTQLRLAPFGTAEAEEFLDALLGASVGADRRPEEVPVGRVGPQEAGAHTGAPLQSLKHLILEKTQGTPFFMEEIVQELIEQGVLVRDALVGWVATHPTTALHVPATVQGVLAARIDRLAPDEKVLLQQLAVIGREFPLGLVKQVVPQSEDVLYRLLSVLQRKEFLYEQPAFPDMEYIFKHALTQEVVYNSVLIERRKVLHEQTARAIEALYSSELEDHYGELAHHYSRSGNTEKAVEYLSLAGQQAARRSANIEAIEYVATALELLPALPDTPARARQELALQMAQSGPLMTLKGWSAPEVEQVYLRARELSQQVGNLSDRFQVHLKLWTYYCARAEWQTAGELAGQLAALADTVRDPEYRLGTHSIFGITAFLLGDVVSARTHFEQGITLHNPEQQRSLALRYGYDFGVSCRYYAAYALWHLGYPDQALKRIQEAVSLSRGLSHLYSLSHTAAYAAWLHQLRRESQTVQEQAVEAITLSREHGFAYDLVMGEILRGWALADQGQHEAGIAQIRQGIASWQAIGSETYLTQYLALLAEAYGKVGQAEEGLNAVAEALDFMNKRGERYYEAELYRLKGTLTLVQKSQKAKGKRQKAKIETSPQPLTPNTQAVVEQEAEECFLKAIDIAQKQQAKSLELRAVMSLVRLRQHQPQAHATRITQHASRHTDHVSRTKLDEAHMLLSEVYNWFTEGFDTKDLQEAKALLEALPES
jgi:class 3 adenylate cyclase/predicted ATPase